MALPENTMLRDLATGWIFYRHNLRPQFQDHSRNHVEMFEIVNAQPEYNGRTVDARLIRHEGERIRCTI